MASTPKAPDPYATARAQGDENRASAQYNSYMANPNVYGTQGQTINKVASYNTFTGPDGKQISVPQWEQRTTLSPGEQRVYEADRAMRETMANAASGAATRASTALTKGFQPKGLPEWSYYDKGPRYKAPDEKYRQSIEDNIMTSFRRGMQPQQAAEQAELAARGQEPGTGMDYARQLRWDDAAGEAARGAFNMSGEEARMAAKAENDVLGQTMADARSRIDQRNAMRGTIYGEEKDRYNQEIGSIAALSAGGQPFMQNSPGFQGGQTAPADLAGLIMQKFGIDANAAAQKNAGIFSILGGVGKLALGASDRRLKTDVKPIGGNLAGAPLYTFKYWQDGTTHVGVMADEVKKIHPDAVHIINGFDHVDYAMLSRRHAA